MGFTFNLVTRSGGDNSLLDWINRTRLINLATMLVGLCQFLLWLTFSTLSCQSWLWW
jgi:hypothetical protein